jgi:hypothetical protein
VPKNRSIAAPQLWLESELRCFACDGRTTSPPSLPAESEFAHLATATPPRNSLDTSDECAEDLVADLAMVALPFEIPCFGNQHRAINAENETRSINQVTTDFSCGTLLAYWRGRPPIEPFGPPFIQRKTPNVSINRL